MKRVITVSLCLFAFIAFSLTSFAQEITVYSQSERSVYQIEGTQAVLYDQTGTPSGDGDFTSQDFVQATNDAFDNQGADDFEVPAGETWTIDEVLAIGSYYNGIGPADGFNIFFYANDNGVLPGTEIYSALNEPYVDDGLGGFTVTLTAPAVLTEGKYWVSVQCYMDFAIGGQWGWEVSSTPNLDPAAWQNPGDGFATGAITYTNAQTVFGWTGSEYSYALMGTVGGGGAGFPEVLYYIFDEAGSDSTYNYAIPGSGWDWAQLFGAMSMGPTGQFDNALIGTGGSSSTDYVATGWAPDLGASDWTISMWLDNMPPGTALNYLFGDNSISWRCFYSGAALEWGVLFRLGVIGGTDITVPNVGPGPSVLHFVYDSSVPDVKAYINGVLVVTQPQAGALTTTGSGPFKVGSYSSSNGLPAGSLMDEFRFYNRALDAAEITATWNISIVPVELTSFSASVDVNDVTLNWETASEINNSGFQVERKSTGEYQAIGFVPGFGTTTEPRVYSFSDANLNPGTYSYRLKQIDYDGTFEYSDPVEVDIIVPDVYSLHQNYPNPFNPSTTITFTLAANANVTLRVFDVLGQEVMTLINQDLTAGVHTYDFDAASFNSGVYFYRIEANGNDGTNFTNVKKMILLK